MTAITFVVASWLSVLVISWFFIASEPANASAVRCFVLVHGHYVPVITQHPETVRCLVRLPNGNFVPYASLHTHTVAPHGQRHPVIPTRPSSQPYPANVTGSPSEPHGVNLTS